MCVSYDDELSIDQILAFVSNLKVEQICITASALLDHYTRVSCQSMSTTEYIPPCLDFLRTPHASSSYHIADDSEGSQHPRPVKREFNADIDFDV